MASVGETLRSAREQRGLSIEQVSHDTRISARFLEALEADRFELLPAPVYVRGFIRSYASYLKLDGAALIARLGEQADPRAANVAARTEARRVDPFRRDPQATDDDEVARRTVEIPRPAAPEVADTISSAPTMRRRVTPPGRPMPPPPVPPDAVDEPVLDEDGYYRTHQAAVLAEAEDSRSPSRVVVFAGIGMVGVFIAVVTAVLLTRGDSDPVATTVPDSTPTRASGTVVVVGTASPSPGSTQTETPQPGATTTGTPTEATSPSPTVEDETPPVGEPTPTPDAGSGSTPVPTVTATIPSPTVPPTATPVPPTATPTPIPTFTPTRVPVQPHPIGFQECSNFQCGDPPLRVICPPDGTWFVDVNKDYPNPGWPENTTAITTSQAQAVGERGCQ